VKRFNLKKLNEMEFRKQYQIKIQKRFEALENLNHSEYINRTWKTLKRMSKSQLKRL